MEVTYTNHEGFYLPNLTLPRKEEASFGRYGRLRLKYLKEHRKVLYIKAALLCRICKGEQPEVLATLIQTIVERIYIVDKDDERYCHIFIKGCSGEDYTGFFQTAGYIEQNTVPVCDSEQYCISKLVYASLCRSVSRKYLEIR